MMMKFTITAIGFATALTGATVLSANSASTPTAATTADAARIARGAGLVKTMGCNDCHTPHVLGPNGVEPDMTRALTGHPEAMKMPTPPRLPEGPWVWMGAATNTAFAGPWGVSYTANLTPDKDTGLGDWTVDQFIATMKTGGILARVVRFCRRCRFRFSARSATRTFAACSRISSR
jgi:hypothetical protein